MSDKKTPQQSPSKEPQAIVAKEEKRNELVLEGDPETQLEYATKASKALVKAMSTKPKQVIISGKKYLEYGDWQTLARFFGGTVGTEWTKPIIVNGKTVGYEARAVVHQRGDIISSAEAMCTRDEKNWKSRDEFMLRSMAQTRAGAKALRNAFGWVAELAGYASTPAEEMPKDMPAPHGETAQVPPKKQINDKQKIAYLIQQLNLGPGKEDAVKEIESITGLPVVEENYPEIVSRLEVTLKERREAQEARSPGDEKVIQIDEEHEDKAPQGTEAKE